MDYIKQIPTRFPLSHALKGAWESWENIRASHDSHKWAPWESWESGKDVFSLGDQLPNLETAGCLQ